MIGAMVNVVITGSTRGIGKGMAREFLCRGHSVALSGRSQSSVDAALGDDLPALAEQHGATLAGVPCEVSDYAQVQNLWDRAAEALGRIDVWINNAGISNSRRMVGDLVPQEIHDVAATNITGTMYGSQIALRGMQRQGSGAIYNFEGLGSNNMISPGLSLYGASKNAVTYFTKCLIAETKGGPVRVGYLSPGIVLTHLSVADMQKGDPDEWEKTKRIYNILADKVDTVTPWLVEGVLKDNKHGSRIAWLTPAKAAKRFALARFNKRDLFEDFDLEPTA